MRYQTKLNINLELLAHNYQLLKTTCPKAKVIFMVKADAYGHGLAPIVHYANTKLGIVEFGCASLGEAKALRDDLPDLEFEIYVFSDIQFKTRPYTDLYLNKRIIPVISNLVDLDFILENRDFRHFPICIKVNTGMNRLGFQENEVKVAIDKLIKKDRKSVYHLLTHFACASTLQCFTSSTTDQYERFLQIKKQFIDSGIELERTSTSNSGAIEQGIGIEETHIRPGIMLYGPSSLDLPSRNKWHKKWCGKTISSLESYIIHSFSVKKDMPIGYGATPAPYDGIVVLIALGYGDGFSARFKQPTIQFKGHTGKILGRVNMDMTQIIFKEDAAAHLKSGEVFTIWGHDQQDVLTFSDQTGTIAYEHFCQLTARVPRIYSGGAM
ncbi:MAG: alanine racemase [Bacteriovoracaceae bacterium]|nr:alanine racemase [Bacteriovoracaceae bacterium]